MSRIGGVLDDSSQLTQVRTNVDPPGRVANGPGLGESPEPHEEEGADERVKELSVLIPLRRTKTRRTRYQT